MEEIWEDTARKSFEDLLAAVPEPLKEVVKKRVLSRIQRSTKENNLSRVGIAQVVEAFREETPGMYRPLFWARLKELGLEEYAKSHE